MTDFLTRVAQKSLGLEPAIQPLVVSRYAPARLPISEALESEPVPKLSAEADRRKVAGRPDVRSPSLVSNSDRQTMAEQSWNGKPDDQPLRGDLNSLSEPAESIGPTQGNEIQQPRPNPEFEISSPSTDLNVNTPPAAKVAASSLPVSDRPPSGQQVTLSFPDSTGFSAGEEPSIPSEGLVSIERTDEPQPSVLRDSPPLQNSPGLSPTAEPSIVDEGPVSLDKADEPGPRVRLDSPFLQDWTGLLATEESSTVDGGSRNVARTGEPRSSVRRDSPPLQDSTSFSAAEESSIVVEGQVNVESTGEPLRRTLREDPVLQVWIGHSAAEESSIIEASTLTGESLESSHRAWSEGTRQPGGNRPDELTASPGSHQTEPESRAASFGKAKYDNSSMKTSHHSRQTRETSDQEERQLHVDEREDYAPESELRSLSAPQTSRRQIGSFNEMFAQKSVPALPPLHDERVENGPPVIRVSIGRVEVRAVTPPPPAVEPPPPAAPKLSLDEFLRQPNGRRQ